MRNLFAGVLILALAGCASYQPKPLPATGEMPAHLAELQPRAIPGRTHVFNPADGLDADELAMLALANNPHLRAARAALHVSDAQVFAAGLLADPQLSLAQDNTMTPGTTNDWALGLGFDVGDWLMRSARRSVARHLYEQDRQNLLWQEWQVVSQAHLLFARATSLTVAIRIQQEECDLLAGATRITQSAAEAGNLTADVASSQWLAWQAARQRLNGLQLQQRQNDADLHDLLGIRPEDRIQLSGSLPADGLDTEQVRRQLNQRLADRPDMRALRAGYQAQDAVYRANILAQFPVLSVGLNRVQDNTPANSFGFGITLALPVFNGNRGNIAIARATRAQLYEEYQLRWQTAVNEILVAIDNLQYLQQLAAVASPDQAAVDRQATVARAAQTAGTLAEPDALRLQLAALDRQMDRVQIEQSLTEQRIALDTLLGPQPGEWK